MPVILRLINSCVSSRSGARCRYVNSNWPSRIRGYSGAIGSFTFTIISAVAQTSSAELTIVAPARSYSVSSKPEPSPALTSTRMSCPASLSARTPAGVSPTRYSLSLISLGRPTSTVLFSGKPSTDSADYTELSVQCVDGFSLISLRRFELVDLGALQFAAEVDIDRLPLRKDVEHLGSGFAMAVTGGFGTAKRQVYFRTDRRSVYVEDAGVHLVHCFERAIDVLCVNRGREPVAHTICDLDCVFERVCRNHSRDWSKDLFLRDTHVRRSVSKDGWLDEVTVCIVAFCKAFATESECRAIVVTPDTDVTHDLLDRVIIDNWSNIGLRIGAVTNAQGFRVLNESRDELFVNFLMDDQPRRRGTTLS